MFSKNAKKEWLSKREQQAIVAAIQQAERATSGEIRLFIEAGCEGEALDRAKEIFLKLEMNATRLRNGVLVYLAYDDHKFCLLGDEGIYAKTGGQEYWEKEVNVALDFFKKGAYVEGLRQVILDIGSSLSEHFPFDPGCDKNELPDEIVFG